MDLVTEANAASVRPFTADDRAGLPGWQKQPAFPIPGLGGGAKKRLTEYDRADVVVGIRFHKHKRLAKAAWRRVDPYRILSAGLYRESKLIELFS